MFWQAQINSLHHEYTCQAQLFSSHERRKDIYIAFIPLEIWFLPMHLTLTVKLSRSRFSHGFAWLEQNVFNITSWEFWW